MSSSGNNYVLITDSQNLGENVGIPKTSVSEENESAVLRALENHGIFLEGDAGNLVPAKPHDQLLREIMNQSGIEIVPGKEEGESFP